MKARGVSLGADSYKLNSDFESNIAVVPAVYHNTLRSQFIQEMDRLGSYGEFQKDFPLKLF